MIEIMLAAGVILSVFCLIGGALLQQGTPTARGLKLGRALDYGVMALWFGVVALFAVMLSR